MGVLVTLIFVIHLTWLGLVIFGTVRTAQVLRERFLYCLLRS